MIYKLITFIRRTILGINQLTFSKVVMALLLA